MSYPLSCNVCFHPSNSRLLNICNYVRQYQILQLLASPIQKIYTKEFWVCATCEMILSKITKFQQQLFRTQKHIAGIIARRKEIQHSEAIMHNNKPTASTSERYSTNDLNETVEKIKIELSDENNESNGVVFLEVHRPHQMGVQDPETIEFIDLDEDSCDNYNANQIDDALDSNSDYEVTVSTKAKVETEITPIKELHIYSEDDILAIIESLKARYVNNLNCCICDFIPSSRGSMMSHMQFLHEKESIGWCKLCNCLESNHNESNCSKNVVCKFCQLTCEDPLYLIEHLYTHCDLTGNKIVDKIVSGAEPELTSQSNLSKRVTRNQYVCRRCRAVYITEASLRLHKCVQSPSGNRKLSPGILPDPNCDRLFSTRTTIPSKNKSKSQLEDECSQLEDERTQSVGKPFMCEYCDKAFDQKSTWFNHMKLHTDRPEKCTQCDKTFSKSSELRVHLRNTHLDLKLAKTFLCNICGHVSRTQGQLNDHMRIHSDERNHKCQQCGVAFKQKVSLRHHMTIHKGVKRHKCPECPYSCHHKHNLKTHAKKHANEAAVLAAENGEHIFTCDHCNRPFSSEDLLLEHIRCSHAVITN